MSLATKMFTADKPFPHTTALLTSPKHLPTLSSHRDFFDYIITPYEYVIK